MLLAMVILKLFNFYHQTQILKYKLHSKNWTSQFCEYIEFLYLNLSKLKYIENFIQSLKNISFPSSVKVIEDYAFSDCKSLTQISIPSAKKIGNYAFKGCLSLVQFKIPSYVAEIGESAFEGCSSLEQIKVPSSVSEIGIQSSEGYSLKAQISIIS